MAFHEYNTDEYNTAQYNADTNTWVVACAETINTLDALIDQAYKVLTEAVTATDATVAKELTRTLTESLLAIDTVTKQVTNKGLNETVRLNDWVKIERKNSNWSS